MRSITSMIWTIQDLMEETPVPFWIFVHEGDLKDYDFVDSYIPVMNNTCPICHQGVLQTQMGTHLTTQCHAIQEKSMLVFEAEKSRIKMITS